MSLLRRPLIEYAAERMSATEKALSTVRFRLPASASSARRNGLVKVCLLRHWSINAFRNASWRCPREMFPGQLMPLSHEPQRSLTIEVVHDPVHWAGAGLDTHTCAGVGGG